MATKKKVCDHIASESSEVFRFPGGSLRPTERHGEWKVRVDSGIHEVLSSIELMLEHALASKTAGLERWNGKFSQRWLLLLNCYPLADDIDDMKRILRRLVMKDERFAGFDGIFWSGRPGRTIVPITL